MVTHCTMPESFRERGAWLVDRTEPRCGRPLTEQQQRDTWMCDECQAQSRERARIVGGRSSVVPMAADVLRVMREDRVDQDDAVRRLGGTP